MVEGGTCGDVVVAATDDGTTAGKVPVFVGAAGVAGSVLTVGGTGSAAVNGALTVDGDRACVVLAWSVGSVVDLDGEDELAWQPSA